MLSYGRVYINIGICVCVSSFYFHFHLHLHLHFLFFIRIFQLIIFFVNIKAVVVVDSGSTLFLVVVDVADVVGDQRIFDSQETSRPREPSSVLFTILLLVHRILRESVSGSVHIGVRIRT